MWHFVFLVPLTNTHTHKHIYFLEVQWHILCINKWNCPNWKKWITIQYSKALLTSSCICHHLMTKIMEFELANNCWKTLWNLEVYVQIICKLQGCKNWIIRAPGPTDQFFLQYNTILIPQSTVNLHWFGCRIAEMLIIFTSFFLMMHLVLLLLKTVSDDLLLLQLQNGTFHEMPLFEVKTHFICLMFKMYKFLKYVTNFWQVTIL